MHARYTDEQVTAKAVDLGLIQQGEELPRHLRSRVVAALLAAAADNRQPPEAEPQLAKEIVVQPGGAILIDGEPFPWLVANEPMDVRLNPDGVSTVRMTLMADAVQILKPEPRKESEHR